MELVQFCYCFSLLTPPCASSWLRGMQAQRHTCNRKKVDVGHRIWASEKYEYDAWHVEPIRGIGISWDVRNGEEFPGHREFLAEQAIDANSPSNGDHSAFQKLKETHVVEPEKRRGSSAWQQAGEIDMEIQRKEARYEAAMWETCVLFLHEALLNCRHRT